MFDFAKIKSMCDKTNLIDNFFTFLFNRCVFIFNVENNEATVQGGVCFVRWVVCMGCGESVVGGGRV